MSVIKQLPCELDLYLIKGDDFIFSIHSQTDLSGYTLSAYCGDMTFKVDAVSPYDFNVTVSKQQSNNIIKEKLWSMEWIDPNGRHRTIIAGAVRTK